MLILELLTLILAFVHFGFPLAYYWYAKTKWFRRPWNLRLNEDYRPMVTVILPTYNEAKYILDRLNNMINKIFHTTPTFNTKIIVFAGAVGSGKSTNIKFLSKWLRQRGVKVREPNLKT